MFSIAKAASKLEVQPEVKYPDVGLFTGSETPCRFEAKVYIIALSTSVRPSFFPSSPSRARAREALVKLQKECHRRWIGYKDEYGNVEAPIDPDVWLDLGEEEGAPARPSTSDTEAVARC